MYKCETSFIRDLWSVYTKAVVVKNHYSLPAITITISPFTPFSAK